MKHDDFNTPANHYFGQHPLWIAGFFVGLAVLTHWFFFAVDDPNADSRMDWLVLTLAWGISAIYLIKGLHSVRFGEEGVALCRFGRIYKILRWSQIVQAGVTHRYKGYNLTLVLTPWDCPKYTGESLASQQLYVERYQRSLILLDATKANRTAIEKWYGPLDYEKK